MQESMTTTAFTLDGYSITKSLGVVRGINVSAEQSLQRPADRSKYRTRAHRSLFTQLCEKTREEAFTLMIAHAQKLGANAIIGVRYDATELMQGVTEVLCYGTAVVVAATH